jgi:hypothetical protein
MKAERLRLKRLQRLEKLRAIARQTALAEAGVPKRNWPSSKRWASARPR